MEFCSYKNYKTNKKVIIKAIIPSSHKSEISKF